MIFNGNVAFFVADIIYFYIKPVTSSLTEALPKDVEELVYVQNLERFACTTERKRMKSRCS